MRAFVSKLVPLLLCLFYKQLVYLSAPKLVTFLSQFTFITHDNPFVISLLSILCMLVEKFPFLSTSILFYLFFSLIFSHLRVFLLFRSPYYYKNHFIPRSSHITLSCFSPYLSLFFLSDIIFILCERFLSSRDYVRKSSHRVHR